MTIFRNHTHHVFTEQKCRLNGQFHDSKLLQTILPLQNSKRSPFLFLSRHSDFLQAVLSYHIHWQERQPSCIFCSFSIDIPDLLRSSTGFADIGLLPTRRITDLWCCKTNTVSTSTIVFSLCHPIINQVFRQIFSTGRILYKISSPLLQISLIAICSLPPLNHIRIAVA